MSNNNILLFISHNYRLGTRIRPNKSKQQSSKESSETQSSVDTDKQTAEQTIENVADENVEVKSAAEEEDVKDAWDADSSSEEESTNDLQGIFFI